MQIGPLLDFDEDACHGFLRPRRGNAFSSGAQGPSTPPERPKFKIEIRVTGEKGPSCAVTNFTGKTVTACVFELSFSLQGRGRSKIVWDAIVQGDPPIEPGGTILRPLSPIAGSPQYG